MLEKILFAAVIVLAALGAFGLFYDFCLSFLRDSNDSRCPISMVLPLASPQDTAECAVRAALMALNNAYYLDGNDARLIILDTGLDKVSLEIVEILIDEYPNAVICTQEDLVSVVTESNSGLLHSEVM